ncbi:MAG: PKD domain-containing protein [Thermoanaerobaculia bacterium]
MKKFLLCLALGSLVAPAAILAGPPPEVSHSARSATIHTIRELPIIPPGHGYQREKPEPKKFGGPADGLPAGRRDPAIGTATVTPSAALSIPSSFAGVGVENWNVRYAPPDTNGAAGPNNYIQWVNDAYAFWDKSGNMIYGPVAGNTIFQPLGGYCAQYNDGDPIVQYDKANGRWILSQFAVSQGSSAGYRQCVAVSQSSDPMGGWNLYEFNYGTNFNDYPKIGVWPDGYYATFNMFRRGSSFNGGEVCAWDAAAMRRGDATANQVCFNVGTSYGGLLPSDVDGSTAPPAGAPNYVLNFGTNSLNVWKFHVDWANPSASTLTGPTNIATAAFSRACGGGTCIPQPGTSNQLDSLADRLMYRLAYRNHGGVQSLVVNHSVTPGNGASSGVRWYELRVNNGNPSLYQQGTIAPDSNSRWMGSAAMDKNGNIVVGYSISSGTTFPDIVYTARTPNDPLGSMPNGEVSLNVGLGSQTGTLHRWGDYSSMSVDPTDDCTMWYTTEYLTYNGTWNWSTRVGKITPPGCGSTSTNNPPVASFTYSCTDLQCSFTDTSTDSDGSVTGWGWTFGDGGTSAAQNPSHTYGAAGSYTVTLTATDNGGASASSSQSVSVTAPPPPGGITLTATASKVKGVDTADLSWSGTTGSTDVYRDGSVIATVSGTSYSDNTGTKGKASFTYQVCNAGTTTCSAQLPVSW